MSVAKNQAESGKQKPVPKSPVPKSDESHLTYYPCPTCGVVKGFDLERGMEDFPFCSARCKTIDLGNWLSDDSANDSGDETGDLDPEYDEPNSQEALQDDWES